MSQNIDITSREYLKAFRDTAYKVSELDPFLNDAYLQLAFAADRVDAILARQNEIPETIQGEGNPISPSELPGYYGSEYNGGCCGGDCGCHELS
jgi:hypothetical protein